MTSDFVTVITLGWRLSLIRKSDIIFVEECLPGSTIYTRQFPEGFDARTTVLELAKHLGVDPFVTYTQSSTCHDMRRGLSEAEIED